MMPLAFQVTRMLVPTGVTGKPLTPVSMNAITGDVPSVPVSFQITSASLTSPVTLVKVASAASNVPPAVVFEPSVAVATRAPATTSSMKSCAAE